MIFASSAYLLEIKDRLPTPLPLANISYYKALLRLFDFNLYSLRCVRRSELKPPS